MIGFVGKYGINIWVPDEQKQYPSDDFNYWFVPGPGRKIYLPDEKGRNVHYTRMMGNKAIEFINEYKDEPFCLSLSFLAPHGSLDPIQLFLETLIIKQCPYQKILEMNTIKSFLNLSTVRKAFSGVKIHWKNFLII